MIGVSGVPDPEDRGVPGKEEAQVKKDAGQADILHGSDGLTKIFLAASPARLVFRSSTDIVMAWS